MDGWGEGWMESFISSRRPLLYNIFLMPKSINTTGKNQGIPLIGEWNLKNVCKKKTTHTHTHTLLVKSLIAKPILGCWECGLQLLGNLMNKGFNSITTRIKLSCLTKLVPYNLLLLFWVNNSWIIEWKFCTNQIPSARFLQSQQIWKHATLFQVEYLCLRMDCVTRHTPKARHHPLETYYNSLVDELPTLES